MTRSRGVGGHNGTPTSQRTSTARVLKQDGGVFFPRNFQVGSPVGWNPPNLWLGKFGWDFFLNPNKRKENKHTKIKHGTSVFKPRFLIAQLPRSPSGVCCSGRFNKPSPVGLAGAMIVKGLGVCAMSRTGPNWWPGVQIVNWLLVH